MTSWRGVSQLPSLLIVFFITEGGTIGAAVFEGLTSVTTAVTGVVQIAAGLSGQRDLAEGANAMSIFTGFSGPVVLLSTNNPETAATASTVESIVTFGASGAVNPVSLQGVADAVSAATDLIFPTENSQKPPVDPCKVE